MKKRPIDPLGHIIIAVKNVQKSKEFYQMIFSKLNLRKLTEKEVGTKTFWEIFPGFCLWIKQARYPHHNYKFHAPGLHHICIKAKSKEEVDGFYKFLLKQKILIYDRPQLYPKYTSDYYAVFFSDPDGMKLELAYY